ncbi:MAG: hypothetical protein UU85_C0004G0038 [Candidatus Wolfebacteria bacterium GW2011_GWA2_42_10]|uniref:Uncharacterized protein n=2 Tax=Candidatus Wolfeibacteriota TaxID=1752735 RepID=A0A0G0XK61_9BACT|nr:MAG: hypothetical protein UU38_C0001G0100 [Candidatus Wolfebacteria bacterium GW2011_GWB1_41_12]KKS25279.1 MAG: hypothetical protein UU85_C0004G0038 [Candidatus Wolfebacteria bacterium GW2011_GWA2_42_10]KKT56719.1 MAG: hypothetical protein UW50_C0001G0288 [Candidatus Wolfebacteria bacterium GW2011_GWA1_44_24]
MFLNIKKIFILLLILGIIFPIFSFAAFPVGEVAGPGGKLPEGAGIKEVSDLVGILTKVLAWIYTILFIIAIIFILIAAFTYLTAQADPEKIKTATRQIMWAAVAIAVALISVSINVIISNFISPSDSGVLVNPSGQSPYYLDVDLGIFNKPRK